MYSSKIGASSRKLFVLLSVCCLSLVACGRDPYFIDDFVGQTLGDAHETLKEVDIEISIHDLSGKERSVFSSQNWTILEQDPPTGSEVAKNDTVKFEILKTEELGPDGPLKVRVPNFVGMTVDEASNEAKAAGADIEVFELGSDSSITKWMNQGLIIVSQREEAGSQAIKARPIELTAESPENLYRQFSHEMVRAAGVSKENRGGQSNVRFVADTSDPDELRYLTEQCVDHYLDKADGAFCYGYASQSDYDVRDPDWTPASDEEIWGGMRPCWSTYGGQAVSGPDSRLEVRVVSDPC